MAIDEIPEGGGFVVTGEEDIRRYRMLTLRAALRLEMVGVRRHGRSAFAIVKREFGLRGSKSKVYREFCAKVGLLE